ncbi:hypothetical protein CN925_05080 [Bacillus sp. AFS055030]|nr:hypothetical protein CN925_05080 [Bacillus sp. AFS055030]
MQQAQSTQAQQQSHMIEPSPYGGQQIQSGHYGQLSQEPVLAPQHYTAQNPTAMYNQVYQYDPTYYGGMQSQYPYMAMNPSQFGNQTNYFTSPQNQFGVQSQQAQMLQQGPFTTPPMFAPSTPYPAHPKKLNQQNNNGQSFQFSSILNQFKNSSGSYDVPKMMSTAGQMMNTMNQVGGLFKQIGGLFK